MITFVCTSFLVTLIIFCVEGWVLSHLAVRFLAKHPEAAVIIQKLIASLWK